jgi:hypothetical protein
MESFPAFILAMIIASVTFLFAFVLGFMKGLRFRHHIPLVCGMFGVTFLLVINPDQVHQHALYELKSWSQYLLLPLFILAPVPYIEKWTGSTFNELYVFFGSLIAALFYFVITAYSTYYFEQIWPDTVWTIFSIIPAFFIFCGIYLCQKFIEGTTPEKPPASSSGKGPVRIPMEKRKYIVVILMVLIFLSPFLLFGILGSTEGCGKFAVYSVNQSRAMNGTIIHLTENDLGDFPKMSSIIKGAANICETQGKCNNETEKIIGESWFACRNGQQLYKYSGIILEYKGNFYSVQQTQIY